MDIVERLRIGVWGSSARTSETIREAAAEIERLRGELAARDAEIARLQADIADAAYEWKERE